MKLFDSIVNNVKKATPVALESLLDTEVDGLPIAGYEEDEDIAVGTALEALTDPEDVAEQDADLSTEDIEKLIKEGAADEDDLDELDDAEVDEIISDYIEEYYDEEADEVLGKLSEEDEAAIDDDFDDDDDL